MNEGLIVLRIMSMKDLYKSVYGVEPSTCQKFHIMTQIPWTFKMLFGFIVDAKVVKLRKHYLVVFGVIGTIAQLLIFTKTVDDPIRTSAALMAYNLSGAFLDATVASITVQ